MYIYIHIGHSEEFTVFSSFISIRKMVVNNNNEEKHMRAESQIARLCLADVSPTIRSYAGKMEYEELI